MIAFDFNQPDFDEFDFDLLFDDGSTYRMTMHLYRSDNSSYWVDNLDNEFQTLTDVIWSFKQKAATAFAYRYKGVVYNMDGTVNYNLTPMAYEDKTSKDEFNINPVWLIVGIGALLVFNLLKK